MSRLVDPFRFLVVTVAGWMNRRQLQVIGYLREDNRVLREQLGGTRIRLNDDQSRRLALKAKGLGRSILAEVATIVTPETLLAWHRKLIARKYDGSSKRSAGRPRTDSELKVLVVRLAGGNQDRGYRRLQGALSHLGREIARSTIAAILERHGIQPAPERNRKTTWRGFLARHWDMIMASEFFTVGVWTKWVLQRFMLLLIIHLATRKVEIAGIAPVVNGLWMNPFVRNLTDAGEGLCTGKRYLPHDRDPLFTAEFLQTLESEGVKPVKLPPKLPNLNAHAERFVRSFKESCLDRMIFFGEASLRKAVPKVVEHYHAERNHQGPANRIICPQAGHQGASGTILRSQRLGGMLNYCYRYAA